MPLQIPISVTPAADTRKIQYARISLPLPRGMFKKVPSVSVHNARGRPVPSQVEPLTRWHDGSARMLHLTFPSTGGEHVATVGGPNKTPRAKEAIRISKSTGGRILVTTGRLVAKIGGRGLVESIRLGREEMIGPKGIEVRVVDGKGIAYTATAFDRVTTHVEVAGPLRTVIALKGRCALEKKSFLNFRLRFEFLAGVEGFSLAYAFHNMERGADFHDVQSLDFELHLASANKPQHSLYQLSYGLYSTLGRVVTTSQSFDVAVDDTRAAAYVRNYEALGDSHEYPFYLNPPCDRVDNWAAISDGRRCMQVEMDDFNLMRPKSLALEGATARFGIWPSWAKTLSLQQGRSREVTVRVALSDRGVPSDNAAIAQLRDVWRATIPQTSYARANFFDQGRVLPHQPGLHPRFENWLESMGNCVHSIATFFDLGDIPQHGYQKSYISIGNRIRRVRSEDGGARYFSTGPHNQAHALNNLDDFEPVWLNNEYDVIYVLGTEYLRTGAPSFFQRLRWWARHTVDVDFMHYSDHRWHHRAQPAHSERHTTTGAYPSHFWTQGLAQYYMLTGDPDALDVIIGLGDKTIENMEDPTMQKICGGIDREIGWSILTLACAYEATGLKRFDAYARKLIEMEVRPGPPKDVPGFGFHHASILFGTRQYLVTHEGEAHTRPIRKWYLDFVDVTIESLRRDTSRSGVLYETSMAPDALAFAHEMTGDKRYIEAGLRSMEHLLDSAYFHSATLTVEGKIYAMVYRTYINYLKPLAELGHLKAFEHQR